MITNKYFKYVYILSLLAFLFAGFLVQNFYFSIICSIYCYVGILFFDNNVSYGLVFMLMPLSGIFDESGFGYLFNLSIWILAIKLIIISIFSKKIFNFIWPITILLLLIVYDVSIATFNDLFTISYFSNFSVWFGYLVLVLSSDHYKSINKRKIFLYSFFGFIYGAILAAIQVYNKWGFNIPQMYRFIGLFRDPNYFALLGIVLTVSSFFVYDDFRKYLLSLTIVLISIFSISKMFIFMIVISALIIILRYLIIYSKTGFNGIYKFVFAILTFFVLIFILNITGIMDTIVSKYAFRFESYDLTTGRDYLQGQYINIFFSDLRTFMFGKSLNYNLYYMIPYADSEAMVAHNTYLDVLISFGIFGTIIYISLIYFILKGYSKNKFLNINFISLISILLIVLFALSYLKADNFMIEVLFILFVSKQNDMYEGCYEYKDLYGYSQKNKLYSQR